MLANEEKKACRDIGKNRLCRPFKIWCLCWRKSCHPLRIKLLKKKKSQHSYYLWRGVISLLQVSKARVDLMDVKLKLAVSLLPPVTD